jgi:hypothetical protein
MYPPPLTSQVKISYGNLPNRDNYGMGREVGNRCRTHVKL